MSVAVPMRWPSGAEWLKPAALSVLDGTPVNCLVLPGAPTEFVAAAKAKGVSVIAEPPAETLKEALWPGVQRSGRGSSTTDSGPTGPPWVDANGWAVHLAMARTGKAPWVPSEPPKDQVLRPEHYGLAVADAEAYGGRWLISLQEETATGLLKGDAQARECWSSLVRALRFFGEKRTAWASYKVLARLGVVSDFQGANEFLGAEVLNLSARRHMPCRILVRPKLDLAGLAAVLWVDEKAPEGVERKELMAFAEAGGTLIVAPSVAHLTEGLQSGGKHLTGYSLYKAGKGSVAVSAQPWTDPYVVASDAQRLMTRREDTFRLWNAGSSNAYPMVSGGRTVAQVLNFTARAAAHPMSLWVARPAKSAVFLDVFGRTEKLSLVVKGNGVEVSLPPFASYAAVEFGDGR